MYKEKKMKEKEEEIFKEIINYFKDNKTMPTRRYLQRKLNYKSINSITQYFKSLEKQNYLIRNTANKFIINDYIKLDDNLKTIKVINTKNDYLHIIINKNKKYLAYKIHHDYFNNQGIIKNDTLIIEETKKIKPNDFGLFLIDNKYRIMKYNYQDGFYILSDWEEILLNRIKIIGKVIMIERKL